MVVINGKGASSGVVMGKLKILTRKKGRTKRAFTDEAREIDRLEKAAAITAREYTTLYESTKNRYGEKEAAIFEIHSMMLEEEEFLEAAREEIRQRKKTAETAVERAGEVMASMFQKMDTEYMKARAADVRAVAGRVAEILRGENHGVVLTEPCILAADDLTPAETVLLDKSMVLGFVTERGSEMSHTAILARMMAIPAVVATGNIAAIYDGETVMLDGTSGELCVDPDDYVRERYEQNIIAIREEQIRLEGMRGKTCVDREGRKIRVYANVGELDDVDEAVKNDAEGVGLFRSEFIFMRQNRPPTEDEQVEIYSAALKKMNGAECVVRTLDVGADKRISYLTGNAKEANPALGIRAIRLCLRMPELLKTQFRALYRAAAYGNLSAMIPMIVLPSEVEKVRELAREARESLENEGINYGRMKVGIMIETPSAAILSDLLAPMVDFFAIGTNDLIQYTLAADRENPDVAYLTKPLPESIRRCIRMTCAAARREGIPVCVCGELGADPEETKFLLDSGVTKLSVAPSQVLRVRERVMQETGLALESLR